VITTFKVGSAAVFATVLLVAFTVAACDKPAANGDTAAGSSTVTASNLTAKVAEARTPQDHEAIAAYYEQRARDSERESAGDRDLQGRYENRWPHDRHPMGPGAHDHLNKLTESHESDAHHFQDMAAWHHEMARSTEGTSNARE